MTETAALKFGPEWLRALSHGNAVASPPPSPGLPKYKLAEYRYGREEMLALFDKNARPPEDMLELEGIASEKCQLPLALVSISEEEQRTWARSVNSEAVLRLMNRGSERSAAPPPSRGGRGGSTERGRGRGRGSYYQRGLSNDEGTDGSPGGFSCPRPFERSQSMHERSQSWEDKERRFDKGYLESGRNYTWRKESDNDEGGWRTTTSSRGEKWADRSSWRNNDRNEREQDPEREWNNREYSVHSSNSRDGSSSTSSEKPFNQKSSRNSKTSWDCDHEGGGDQLPEWSTEDNGDVGFVGTFDSSGAFLESKLSDSQISGNDEEEKSKISSEDKDSTLERVKKRVDDTTTSVRQHNDEKQMDSSQSEERFKKRPEDPISSRQHKGEREKVCSDNIINHPSTANDEKQFPTHRITEPTSRKQSVDTSNRCKSSPPIANSERESPVPSNIQETQSKRTCLSETNSFNHNSNNSMKIPTVVQSGLPTQKHKDIKGVSSVPNIENQSPVSARISLHAPNLTGVLTAGSDCDKHSEDVNFDHLEKAAENLVAKWTAEDDEKVAQTSRSSALPIQHEDAFKWFYRDPQGQVQGPFTTTEMAEWFTAGYFTMNLSVRRGCDERFAQLGELIKRWNRIPFTPGPAPPPLLNTPPPVPPPAEHLTAQPIPPHLSEQEQQLYLLQQQILQQQLVQQMMQQQMFMRNQVHIQQALSNLKETEGFNNLNPGQQQQLLMQQMLLQQLQLPTRPPGQEVIHPEMLQQFQRVRSVNPTMMKDGTNSWNSVIVSGGVPAAWEGNAKPQPNSVWDVAGGVVPGSNTLILQDLERKLKEESDRVEEERQRVIQQRHIQEEEALKRQEELKREEALKLQKEEEERKQKEAERLRLEEMIKEKERLLAEEQQRRKIEEELRRKEQQRLEEELKRKEEEKKRKEERRRQEEERKKKEQQELELQRQKEAEQLKEFQRQQMEMQQLELQRQQEIQRQEMLQKEILAKQQEIHRQQQLEALQKLQEKQKAERAKAQAPAWGVKIAPATNETVSLVEIQKLQEEKERHEREEQRQRMIQAQQQQAALLQKQQQQQQENKANASTPWSRVSTAPGKQVKNLLEIQQEEAEKLSKQQKQQQQQQQQQQSQQKAQNNVCLLNAGVWSNASTHLSWATATATTPPTSSKWGSETTSNSVSSNSTVAGGFWDEALAAAASRTNRTSKTTEPSSTVTQNAHVIATFNATKAPKNTRNKKEEDAVLKIFESRTQKTDEFTQWCIQALSALQSTVDIPTFVAFLKDVESSFDVHDYVRSYLGENKEAQDFAKEFLERRSKHKNRAKKHEEENMWGPAPAINPANKNQPIQNSEDGQKGAQKKKKKNKMQKVDNSILGFTVHAAIDRINVGEIEHLEGI